MKRQAARLRRKYDQRKTARLEREFWSRLSTIPGPVLQDDQDDLNEKFERALEKMKEPRSEA